MGVTLAFQEPSSPPFLFVLVKAARPRFILLGTLESSIRGICSAAQIDIERVPPFIDSLPISTPLSSDGHQPALAPLFSAGHVALNLISLQPVFFPITLLQVSWPIFRNPHLCFFIQLERPPVVRLIPLFSHALIPYLSSPARPGPASRTGFDRIRLRGRDHPKSPPVPEA